MEILPPLDIPWTRKPLSSARTDVSVLADGRLKLWIEHEIIHGVTPGMLVWWFKHIEGDVEIAGKVVPRYRAWHPIDHVAFRVARRLPDGSVGPGAVFHIREAFAANPSWGIDIHTHIEKLDESGFVHVPKKLGAEIARMEYVFEAAPGGTRYTNWLLAGSRFPLFGPLANRIIRPLAFPEPKAIAWLTHNVEEVGNFESFLPALYESAHVGR